MAINDILLILMACFCATLVLAAWKLDKERIYSVILLFLILITIGGGKIVEFFDYETNTGNIFFASVFLATYFLIERYGKREGIRSIGIGVAGVLFFTLLLQIIVALTSTDATAGLDSGFTVAFEPITRIAFASIVGYILSQTFNVYFYTYLKERYARKHLWLRANVSNVLAQVLDSAVFFTVAFWGVVAPANIGEIMLVGFAIKVIFIAFTSLFLYSNHLEKDTHGGYTSVRSR